jgi:hypothetical protein
MNQPKFKFGDKVYLKNGVGFQVNSIIQNGNGEYLYNSPRHFEHDLELYQEPQKKKLYAFSYPELGPMEFFKSEQEGFDYGVSACTHLKRAPDYDIEYLEK